MLTSKLYVEAVAHTADGDRPFVARGQVAKALTALVSEGDRGVSALEVASWAYRLAACTVRTLCPASNRRRHFKPVRPKCWSASGSLSSTGTFS
jgi:hypothetical protein